MDYALGTGLVELRVHGVRGTTPESLLKVGVDRLSGDDLAGFYRQNAEEPSGHGEPIVEAYSWGGLTSKSWTRTLWVLLAPFAFVNVAGWMLPKDPGPLAKRRWAHRLSTSTVRLAGLYLTLMAVHWIGRIAMDFGAFQCGGVEACRSNFGFLRFLGWSYFTAPGRRIALGATVPTLLAVGLWLLSRVSRGRYETVDSFTDPGRYPTVPDEEEDSFADNTIWRRAVSMRDFAELHLAASLALVGWTIAGSLAWVHDRTGNAALAGRGGFAQLALEVVRWGSITVLVLTGIAVAGRSMVPPRDEISKAAQWRKLVRPLLTASIVFLLASIVVVSMWPAANPAELARAGIGLGTVPSTSFWPTYIVFAIVIIFVFGLAVHPSRGKSTWGGGTRADTLIREALSGWGALGALLLSYVIASVSLSGLAAGSARLLGGRPMIDYPRTYDAYAVGIVLLLFGLVAAGAVRWRSRTQSYGLSGLHAAMPPEESGRRVPKLAEAPDERVRWLKALRRRRVMRLFVGDAERITAVGLVIAFAFITLDFALDLRGGSSPTGLLLDAAPSWFESASTWTMAIGVPALALYVVGRSFSSRTARKTVGILWDVTTLWPRWYHPMAPPSYAGRAVPELRARLHVLARSGHRVVVSAHSQGSVLAVVALDGLRQEACIEQLGLVTHGSPVGRFYLKYFPAHMAPSIERIDAALNQAERTRWVNLYRLTDPIGGAIGGEVDAIRGAPLSQTPPDGIPWRDLTNPLEDPAVSEAIESEHFPRRGDPEPLGHSDYYASKQYADAVTEVARGIDDSAAPRSG